MRRSKKSIAPATNNALRENLVLQKRRQLLDEGVPREKHKITNLELFNDRVKVPIDMPEDTSVIVKGFWLGFISILKLSTRSIVNFERRTMLANAIISENLNLSLQKLVI